MELEDLDCDDNELFFDNEEDLDEDEELDFDYE